MHKDIHYLKFKKRQPSKKKCHKNPNPNPQAKSYIFKSRFIFLHFYHILKNIVFFSYCCFLKILLSVIENLGSETELYGMPSKFH